MEAINRVFWFKAGVDLFVRYKTTPYTHVILLS